MRKITINTFLTVDGVMQAPGGPEEDKSGGFQHGGWSVKYWDDQMGQNMADFMGKPFDLLLGRKTYEIFSAYWPYRQDDPTAAALGRATKYVASRTLKKLEWHPAKLLGADVARAVAELKRGDGPEIQMHGSGNFIQTLLEHDLVDEFRLWFFPLVLGTGKRLFPEGTVPIGLKPISSQMFTTGVIFSKFEGGGSLGYDSFTHEEPSEAEIARREKVAAGRW